MRLNQEHIYRTLRLISRRYNTVANKHTRYTISEMECLCKLAILELGGWIEGKVDSILLDYVHRNVTDVVEQTRIESQIIGRVYGFDYERNFRPLLERILGVASCTTIMARLDTKGLLQPLISELRYIWACRGRAAHTNWEGVTRMFDAPSVTISHLSTIYPIIKSIEKSISKV